jgi:hypothetical protein
MPIILAQDNSVYFVLDREVNTTFIMVGQKIYLKKKHFFFWVEANYLIRRLKLSTVVC